MKRIPNSLEMESSDAQSKLFMDPRFDKITDLVINYSAGNFDYKLLPTGKFDEVDAFITIMNMVGEELQASMISRNYFNDIFNSVSDMLFVLNNKGVIETVNQTVQDKLDFKEFELMDQSINMMLTKGAKRFEEITSGLGETKAVMDLETVFHTKEGSPMPVFCTLNFLFNKHMEKIGYLLIARDLSKIKKYERYLRESEEKYRRIFEESSDAIFVVDRKGFFLDLNQAGINLFQVSPHKLPELNLFRMIVNEANSQSFREEIFEKGILVDFKVSLFDTYKNPTACLISANLITNEAGVTIGFQGIIKNVSRQKALENLVIRTIVDTQEKERIRFAMDLHDSLGQQLSAIKFYLATLKSANDLSSLKSAEILKKSNDALDKVLSELRSICFNLMPGTLQNFGLNHAVQELCKKIEFDSMLEFSIDIDADLPPLDKPLEIAIFRIVQEFINNSIRHGHAQKVIIRIKGDPGEYDGRQNGKLKILLEDDGVGFEVGKVSLYEGMGIKNVKSRVESYNGEFRIFSRPDKGVRYEVSIPYPKY